MKYLATIALGLCLCLSASSCRERMGTSNTANAADRTMTTSLKLDRIISAANEGINESVKERMEGKQPKSITDHLIHEIDFDGDEIVGLRMTTKAQIGNIPYKCNVYLEGMATLWRHRGLADCSPDVAGGI
ncbi:MAG: hypothetical protein AB7T49_07070 [Oligoflexales bacterium]